MFEALKNAVWGLPTTVLLLVLGIYFTHKSKFYRPKALLSVLRDTVGSLKKVKNDGISPFAAVATALGGTVGVGSIVGVGYALSVGGAGSIFWMWVCSFFGMGLKYAEVRIALNKRVKINNSSFGGAPFRLRGEGYRLLACLFCFLCIAASFGTGNLTQVGAISGFLKNIGCSQAVCAVVCVSIIAAAVFGGRKRISGINAFIVPVSSAIYIAVCLVFLAINIDRLPSVFSEIFGSAFGFSSVAGGFSGALLSTVIREGFARSMFSNEAGMGSSPLAHATSDTDSPEKQAKWGIFEIFFDTFVVSTVTALCLLSVAETEPSEVFSLLLGAGGKWLFGALTAVFAFASVISWCYYAECCLSFLFKKSRLAFFIYRALFSLCAVLGVFASEGVLWALADILNALMMLPNLFLLYKCRNEIERVV